MTQALVQTSPAPLAPPLCDRDGVSLATHSYSWEWGETGVCCAAQVFLLQQVAGQIGRTIQFAPLAPPELQPLTRTERIALKSELYALEAEIEDAKTRGLDLYRENGKLMATAQALSVRGRETEAQLRDATIEVARVTVELSKRDAEHGNLVDELERLRTLETFHGQTETLLAAANREKQVLTDRISQLVDRVAELEKQAAESFIETE